MVQPISLLMSHFNLENTARTTPAALAAAQDTVQGQELVRDSIRITQTVQASEAAAEAQKVHRRTDEEEQEGRRQDAEEFQQKSGKDGGEAEAPETPKLAEPLPRVQGEGAAAKGFDFYL